MGLLVANSRQTLSGTLMEEDKIKNQPKRRILVYFTSLFSAWGYLALIATFSIVKKPLSEEPNIEEGELGSFLFIQGLLMGSPSSQDPFTSLYSWLSPQQPRKDHIYKVPFCFQPYTQFCQQALLLEAGVIPFCSLP